MVLFLLLGMPMMPMGAMIPQIPAVQQPMIPADMGGGRKTEQPSEDVKEVSKPKKMKKRKV